MNVQVVGLVTDTTRSTASTNNNITNNKIKNNYNHLYLEFMDAYVVFLVVGEVDITTTATTTTILATTTTTSTLKL